MYDLVDRPVSALPEGSRFLLWAMRAWVATRARNACPPAQLAPAFLKMGVIEALPHFHLSMSALNGDAREMLSFHCLHAPGISESEAVLLRLWSDMAAGEERRAIKVMDLLLKGEAVTKLFSSMHAALPGLRAGDLSPEITDTCPVKGNAR